MGRVLAVIIWIITLLSVLLFYQRQMVVSSRYL